MARISRRNFLQTAAGVLGAGALLPSMTFGNALGNTVHDRLWMWAHIEGSYDNQYGLPNKGYSRMTPFDAAKFLDIDNVCFLRYSLKPDMPYDEYAAQYRHFKRLMWGFCSEGRTSVSEQEYVLELSKTMPNLTGLFMDDFFKGNALPVDAVSRLWLAENNVTFPVSVTFHFEKPMSADRLELEQTAWRTGYYRTKDIAVDLREGENWKELQIVRLENREGALVSLALPNTPLQTLRLRLLGTHDTEGAHSVGLGGVRFLKGDQPIDLSTAQVEASSTFPGHPPENLLNSPSTVESEAAAAISVARVREIRTKMQQMNRNLDLAITLYTHQLNPAIRRHLELVDVVSLWSWTANDLAKLPENFAKFQEIAPKKRILLGIYMWDFGLGKPYPMDLMKMQCDMGLKWLQEGMIEGMIFLGSNICDLDIEAVRWSKKWIAEHGKIKIS